MPGGRTLTDFEFTLLGLVARDPMSGYDIKKAFASSPLRRYSPSSGGLYPALSRLQKLGLLNSQIERTSEVRARRVFSPTEAGLKLLEGWLHQPVDREMVVLRMEYIMMRFALMESMGSRDQVVVFLEQLRDVLRSYVEELEGFQRTVFADATLHQRLSLRHGVEINKARLAWAELALGEVGLAPVSVDSARM